MLAKTASDATPTTETEDGLSDATTLLQPPKKDISSDKIQSENIKEVEDERESRGCEQAGKSTDPGPGDTGTITAKGHELAEEWTKQQQKRCQDNYNMHIFNDWNGYGISEVIETIVREDSFARVEDSMRANIDSSWPLRKSQRKPSVPANDQTRSP